jgi:hypothetical protein
MNLEEINEKIRIIRSFLNEKEINQDIVEVDNVDLIDYLENIGSFSVQYETGNIPQFGKFTELGGTTDLWYKDINDIWIIKNWEINRLIK